MQKSVSILVCFYNAEHKLPKTIEHIQNLDISGIEGIEVLFIDNKSTDNSQVLIHNKFEGFTKFPYAIHYEPIPGVANARKLGLQKAAYDIILFCDDDNWFFPDYIKLGLDIMTNDIEIGILGGQGILTADVEIPEWVKEKQIHLACGPQAEQTGLVRGKRNIMYGAGMFMRKDLYFELVAKGFKIMNLSRTGKKLTTGEDDELCFAMHIAGYKVWYDERLQFYHFATADRLSKDYFTRLQKGGYQSSYITRFYLRYLNGYKPQVTKYFWLKEFLYSVKDLAKGLFVNPTKLGIKRNFDFSMYLLRERGRYNENVRKVLKICENLDNSPKNIIE